MEAIRSSEKPVHTRSTRRHISEDGILHLQKDVRCESGADSPSEQAMNALYTILIYIPIFHVNDFIRRHTTSAIKTAS
jgi:hypothetical protein